jgi:hypothetical protein
LEGLLYSATIAGTGQIPHQPALARRALLPLHREVGLRLLETYRSSTASGFPGAYGGIGKGHNDPERNE